jgi:selenoprotein W-related protein
MAETETPPLKVTITYCAECGYETQTLSLAEALMKAFTHELTSIELVPWYEGSFDVAINGELVHSMYREGGFPDNGTMVEAVKKRLATSPTTA